VDRSGEERLNLGPEEAGIVVGEVCRTGVAKQLIDARFGELVIKGIQLPRIKGIAELSNEIGRPHDGSLTVNLGMITIFGPQGSE
jgi:hypothetical protein